MNKRIKKISACVISSVLTITLLKIPMASAQTIRYDGIDRIQTALNIAQSNWKDSAENVVIAGANNECLMDALMAAPYAKAYNAPIIINYKGDVVDSDVLAALRKWNTKNIFIASGENTLSKKFEDSLKSNGYKVVRVGSDDIVKSSINAATTLKFKTKSIKDVFIVSDDSKHIIDSLSVASIASMKGAPILVSKKDEVPKTVKEFIDNNNVENVYVIGGSSIISDDVKIALNAIRLYGDNRYGTNINVLDYFNNDLNFDNVYISSADNSHIVDSLAGSVLAANNSSPIVLVGNKIIDPTKTYMKHKLNEDTNIGVFGGEGAVSKDILKMVELIKYGEDEGIYRLTKANSLSDYVIVVELMHSMSDVTKDNFIVKNTENGRSIPIKSVEKAPWDKEGNTYIVHMSSRLDAGKEYTINDVKFTSKDSDMRRPEIESLEPYEFDKVCITFSEPINKDKLSIVFKDNLSGDVLKVKSIDYAEDDPSKIYVTTDEQSGTSVYECNIYGAYDMDDNYMLRDDERTFEGIQKDVNTKLEIQDVEAISSKNILIRFNTHFNEDAALNIDNYSLRELSGFEDNIDIDSIKLNDKTSVILTLKEAMKDSTLYNVSIKNMTTYSGVSIDPDKQSLDFIGVGPFVTPMDFTEEGNEIIPISSKRIRVVFKRHMNEEYFEPSNFNISNVYTGENLYINSLSVIDDKTVDLKVEPMQDTLYKLTVNNLLDLDGNKFVSSKSSRIFRGTTKSSDITSIKKAELQSDNVTLLVEFDNMVGSNAEDVTNYTIDNGINHPSKVELVEGNPNVVKLTIPKTINNRLYKLTVSGLLNSDGDEMKNDVSCYFAGSGKNLTYPELKRAEALDRNTLKITFDRSVKDPTIDNKIWFSDEGTLKQNTFVVKGKYKRTLTNYKGLYAYQDPEDENSLIVRNGNATFTKADANDDNEFVLTIDGVEGKATFDYDNSYMENIEIEKIEGINERTIRVYFNQPVEIGEDADIAKLVTSSSDANKIQKSGYFNSVSSALNVKNGIAIDDTHKVYDFRVSGGYMSDRDYYFVVNPRITKNNYDGIHEYTIGDASGFVTFDDESSRYSGIQYDYKFRGSGKSVGTIRNVSVIMKDCKTIEVTFPEIMNSDGYDDVNSVLNKNNYKIVDNSGNEIQHSFMLIHATDIEYDRSSNKAVITLNQELPDSSSGYYLKLSNTIQNALGTKYVRKSTAGTDEVVVKFLKSTKEAEKLAVNSNLNYLSDSNTIEIKLNMKCFSTMPLDKNILLADFIITVVDENGNNYEISPSDISNIITDVKDSYSSSDDTIKVVLKNNVELKSGAIGKVKLVGDSTLKGVNGENSQESTGIFVQ